MEEEVQKTRNNSLKSLIYILPIIGGIQYFVLTIIAMFLYPGGTNRNTSTEGYIFTENFLSDLGIITAHNGVDNTFCAIIYAITLTVVGLTTILLFTQINQLLKRSEPSLFFTILKIITISTGILAGIGFVGIAFTPADLYFDPHIFFVKMGFYMLLLALVSLMIAIFMNNSFPKKYAYILVVVTIILTAYVLLISFGPDFRTSDKGLVMQVVGQKIIVYILLLGLTYQAIGARQTAKKLGII